MASTLVRDLIDSGIHFGHRVSRWNPKMAPYIFGKRNAIHIIDIKQTVKGLLLARKFLSQLVAKGDDVLFVGTKRQARSTIEAEADRCAMPYVTERWLGGTLTNFRTIRSRLSRLEELEQMAESGELDNSSKKMRARLLREKRKISRNLSGVRKMDRLPGALVVIDSRREHNAVNEARKLGIPTICLLDTDSDPDSADIAIPGNDDAMRAIEVIVSQLAEAITGGVKGRVVAAPDAGDESSRRRSRRTTTARADDVAASVPEAAPVAETPVTPVVETPPAPAVETPPAPAVETPAAPATEDAAPPAAADQSPEKADG